MGTKHFPESNAPVNVNPTGGGGGGGASGRIQNTSQQPKHFWILGHVLDSRDCFWILARGLDSGKVF